jgi:ribosomal protein S18 acetylase RimI-like enzyme
MTEPVELLDSPDIVALREPLTVVYRSAFQAAPYLETDADAERFASDVLPRHAAREGFRLIVAHGSDGDLVGFGYGYTSAPGQWWHDRVAGALGEPVASWLPGAFEVVSLAVRGDRQGQGIGGRLLDELVEGVERGVLSVWENAPLAVSLYVGRGWQVLGRTPLVEGGRPMLILAIER